MPIPHLSVMVQVPWVLISNMPGHNDKHSSTQRVATRCNSDVLIIRTTQNTPCFCDTL